MHAKEIAERLGLKSHPEGGYFKEVYRSDENIPSSALPARYGEKKSFCTAIYYLITSDGFSAMHRLKSDEVLHFYMGGPARVFMLFPDGRAKQTVLGSDLSAGARPQIVLPGGVWFGIRVIEPNEYTLTGTTVAPGFDFTDFELGDRRDLLTHYPEHSRSIRLFTRR